MPGRFRDTLSLRKGPPFIASNDIARGIIHAVQSALHFAIMLALMYVPAFRLRLSASEADLRVQDVPGCVHPLDRCWDGRRRSAVRTLWERRSSWLKSQHPARCFVLFLPPLTFALDDAYDVDDWMDVLL